MPCILGVDFDNTLVQYDELMHKRALQLGLITPDVVKNKKVIRDTIRQLPDGENEWQRLQAFAYGKGIDGAVMFEGVKDFFHAFKAAGICVYVVSHKTKYAVLGEDGINLREAALGWMTKNGFFESDGMGLSLDRVYFEPTQEKKINKIKQLGCTHFIDDLEELFLEKIFPNDIEKILFAAQRKYFPSSSWRTFSTWQDINEYFGTQTNRGLIAAEVKVIEKLIGEPVVLSEKIGKGSNGRVHRIKSQSGKQYAAKFYFSQDTDTRDRLEAEFSSLSFLWGQGVRCIPEPKAVDKEEGCAIYQYIEGRKILPDEVTGKDINQVVDFLKQLKNFADKCELELFQPASEAYFSISDIVENIERRLERLQKAADEESLRIFLESDLIPFFTQLVDWCQKKTVELDIAFDSDIRREERTLSPSDFGFHNALRGKDGRIVFLDFEYFGWDDPVKMISDFLLHPAVVFDESLKEKFMEEIENVFCANKDLLSRLEIVYPLFGFKWCLIFLNEYIPDELQRRNFAKGNWNDQADRRREQLAKARKMLNRMKKVYKNFPYKNLQHTNSGTLQSDVV